GSHCAERPTRSQRSPLPHSASLRHVELSAPPSVDDAALSVQVRFGPQYWPAMQSSFSVQGESFLTQPQAPHLPALQVRPDLHTCVASHESPTARPGVATAASLSLSVTFPFPQAAASARAANDATWRERTANSVRMS